MRLHGNAELSLNKRRGLVRRVEDEGWTLREASEAAEVSVRTARKWVRRYRSEGEPGLALARDRPPNSPLHPTQVGPGTLESNGKTNPWSTDSALPAAHSR